MKIFQRREKQSNSFIERIIAVDYDKVYTTKVRILAHALMWIIFTLFIFLGLRIAYRFTPSASLFFSIRYLLCNITVFYFLFYFIVPQTIDKQKGLLLILFIPICVQLWLIINYYYFIIFINNGVIMDNNYLESILRETKGMNFWKLISPKRVIGRGMEVFNSLSPFLFTKIVFDLTRTYSKKLKIEKRVKVLQHENLIIENKFLSAQLNPHFLFNTLNNLYGLVIKQDPAAPDVILKLSEIMRYTLHEANTEKIALEKELDFVDSYINMEQIRYSKKYTIEKEITNHGIPGLKIAPLLFFVFIENAFKYGLKSTDPYLKTIISVENKTVTFSIENDVNPVATKSNHPGGIGIQNIKKRLELLYPQKHVLEINSSSTLYSVFLKIELENG